MTNFSVDEQLRKAKLHLKAKQFEDAKKITQLNDTNVCFNLLSKTLKYFDVYYDKEKSLKITFFFSANCNL